MSKTPDFPSFLFFSAYQGHQKYLTSSKHSRVKGRNTPWTGRRFITELSHAIYSCSRACCGTVGNWKRQKDNLGTPCTKGPGQDLQQGSSCCEVTVITSPKLLSNPYFYLVHVFLCVFASNKGSVTTVLTLPLGPSKAL